MINNPLTLHNIDGFIFDLDGTLYLGEAALPGACETLAEIRRQQKRALFVTNKPLYPRQDYAAKLTRLGIPASPQDVITSSYVLGYQLAATTPHLRLYVVGEENLKIELREHGLTIHPELWDQNDQHVINPNGIDAVIVAFDRTFDYRKLNTAYQALLHGARYFATNPDKTCPMPGGAIPDAGVTIAALKVLTGREPEIVAGKPSRLMVEVAMKRLGLPPDRCLMVGDRLETDIRMGKDAGMYAAVVLTGSSTRQQVLDATPKPDLMLNNLTELYDLIRQSSH